MIFFWNICLEILENKIIFIYSRFRYFQDGAMPFSDNLRLRAAMFNHHMPWSYKSLFEGYGLDQESTPVEVINSVLNL